MPECPYRVTIPAPVINEIRILTVEAFYSVPRGGVEIGGVFFGDREENVLRIRDYRPISCQYATGPSFTLSIKDQLGLSGLLEAASSDPALQGMETLGWYHSHTRSEIFLSPADLQLYSEFFPERWQIAMVVRPANLQPTRAGFFFRNHSGVVKSDASIQEFRLQPPGFGLEPYDPGARAANPDEAPEPMETVPAFAAKRPSTVPAPPLIEFPVDSRLPDIAIATAAPAARESHAIPPLELALAAAESSPEAAPAVSVEAISVDTAVTPADPAVSPEPPIIPPKAALKEVPMPAPEASVEVNLPAFLTPPKPKGNRNMRWIWALCSIVLLVCGAGAAALSWDRFAKPIDIGLETYDINGSFLVRWDRDSRLIRSATRATLEIQDGGEKPPPIELTPMELLAGGYGYMRRSGQVSVHMKVEGQTPAEEYSNFNSAQSLGSMPPTGSEAGPGLAQALAEKEHLKTELINESMQSEALRREIASLRRQLAEERARNTSAPK